MRRKNRTIGKTLGVLACLIMPLSVHAGDYTWTGAGADTNVSTPENWASGQAPVGTVEAADNLFIDGGSQTQINEILFDRNGDFFQSIVFNANAGIYDILSADGVRIMLGDGALILNNSYNQMQYNNGIFEAEQYFEVGMDLLGDLTINTENGCVAIWGDMTSNADNAITKLGEHTLALNGDNSASFATIELKEGALCLGNEDDNTATVHAGNIFAYADTDLVAFGVIDGNVILKSDSSMYVGESYYNRSLNPLTITGDLVAYSDTRSYFRVDLTNGLGSAQIDQATVEGDIWMQKGHILRYYVYDVSQLTADPDADGGAVTNTFRLITCTGDMGIVVFGLAEGEGMPAFDELVTLENPALLDGHLVYTQGANPGDPDTVDLVIEDVKTISEFVTSNGGNASLAGYIDVFLAASYAEYPTSTGLANLFRYLQYVTPEQLTQVMSELSNSVQSASVSNQVAMHLTRSFSDNLSGHISQRRANQPSVSMFNGLTTQPHMLAQDQPQADSTNDVAGKSVQDVAAQGQWGVFAKAYGLFANQDTVSQLNGYNADTVGVQFGLDCQINDQWLVGFAFDYAQTDVTLDSNGGDIEMYSVRIGPFVSYAKDAWSVDASLTYGNHSVDTKINTGFWGISDDSYEANDLTFHMGVGYQFKLNDKWDLTPTASMQYTYYNRAGYTQSATGFAIDSQDINTLHSRLGVKLSGQVKAMNLVLLPELAVGWEHEFIQDDDPVNANSFGSYAFSSKTLAAEENSVYFSAGLTALVKDNCSVFVNYEGNIGSDSDTHGITGGVRFTF